MTVLTVYFSLKGETIVTKDIPDNAVAVGNPARVVKIIEKK